MASQVQAPTLSSSTLWASPVWVSHSQGFPVSGTPILVSPTLRLPLTLSLPHTGFPSLLASCPLRLLPPGHLLLAPLAHSTSNPQLLFCLLASWLPSQPPNIRLTPSHPSTLWASKYWFPVFGIPLFGLALSWPLTLWTSHSLSPTLAWHSTFWPPTN